MKKNFLIILVFLIILSSFSVSANFWDFLTGNLLKEKCIYGTLRCDEKGYYVQKCNEETGEWFDVEYCNKGCEDGKCVKTDTTTCTESWSCGSWSTCVNGQQTRTCTDKNNCGTTANKSATTQGCKASATCIDSDNGKSYEVQGTVYGYDADGDYYKKSDYCSENYLTEYYCSNNDAFSVSYYCKTECVSGACNLPSCSLSGDVNNDGILTCDDYDCIKDLFLEMKSKIECPCGDVNGNGVSGTIGDVQKTINILLAQNISCELCTDNDNDKYYSTANCGTSVDCNDNNANINPSASEACDNNIDENCDGVDGVCSVNQTILCYQNSDCGTDITIKYCFGSNSCVNNTYYNCFNPRTTQSYCSINSIIECEICQNGCDMNTNDCIQATKPPFLERFELQYYGADDVIFTLIENYPSENYRVILYIKDSENILGSVELFGDGNHYDNNANDGIFGNIFDSSRFEAKTYDVYANVYDASSSSNIGYYYIGTLRVLNELYCNELLVNGPQDKNINIFFVIHGYEENVLDRFNSYSFYSSVIEHLLSLQPFSSNKNKFNFYSVVSTLPSNHPYNVKNVVSSACKIYSDIENNQFIVLSAEGSRSSADPANNMFTIAGDLIPIPNDIVAHEFGHTFANLADEYFTLYDRSYLPGDLRKIANSVNIDIEGCPKWCSGQLNISAQCYSNYSGWKECVNPYLMDYYENHENMDLDEQEFLNCWNEWDVWGVITSQTDKGNRTTYKHLNTCSLGVNCREETECVFTAHNTNIWRSIMNGIMSGINDANYVDRYGIISEEHMQNLIDELTSEPYSKIGVTKAEITSLKKEENVIFFDEFDEEGNIISGGSINLDKLDKDTKYRLMSDSLTESTKRSFKQKGKIFTMDDVDKTDISNLDINKFIDNYIKSRSIESKITEEKQLKTQKKQQTFIEKIKNLFKNLFK